MKWGFHRAKPQIGEFPERSRNPLFYLSKLRTAKALVNRSGDRRDVRLDLGEVLVLESGLEHIEDPERGDGLERPKGRLQPSRGFGSIDQLRRRDQRGDITPSRISLEELEQRTELLGGRCVIGLVHRTPDGLDERSLRDGARGQGLDRFDPVILSHSTDITSGQGLVRYQPTKKDASPTVVKYVSRGRASTV